MMKLLQPQPSLYNYGTVEKVYLMTMMDIFQLWTFLHNDGNVDKIDLTQET